MEILRNTTTQNINMAQLVVNIKSDTPTIKTTFGYKLNNNNDNGIVSDKHNDKQAQLHKIKETIRKSKDGSALIKTFEGALGETVNIIHKMKALAVEAGNPECTDSDRVVIETEYRDLCHSIDDLANTSYSDYSLLSGNTDISKIETAVNTEIPSEIQNTVNKIALFSIGTVNCGDLTVTGTDLIEGKDYSYVNNTLTILSDKSMILSGTSTVDHIVVKSGINANLTFNDLNLQFNDGNNNFTGTCAFKIEDNSSGNVNITLVGENTLKSGSWCAGLQKSGGVNTGTLTIGGNGVLNSVGRDGGAGIGGGRKDGTYDHVKASDVSGCKIIINSGTINATAEGGGAGIGGGVEGDARNITINGGIINATSDFGVGIGGGSDSALGLNSGTWGGNAVNIVINGGTIYAEGHNTGIGSASWGHETDVKINGGKITAEGKNGGAGIGCYHPADEVLGTPINNSHKITITGGEVLAVSTGGSSTNINGEWIRMCAAGIGTSGNRNTAFPAIISISGKDTVVIAYSENADNIGSGRSGASYEESTVTLSSGLISEEFNGSTKLGNITGGTIVRFDPDAPEPPTPTPDTNPSDLSTNKRPNTKPISDFGGIVLQMGLRSKDAVRFTFDYAPNGIGYLQNDLNCTAHGLGLNSLSMDTEENAVYALNKIDYALNKATAVMSRFSMAQSKFNSITDGLQNPSLNFIYDNSDIKNTDTASETLEYVKQFIVYNAGNSIAAQSAQISQAIDLLE